MNKKLLKKIGVFTGIIVLFLVLAYAFVPQVLEGKIVNQDDFTGYVGMSQEATQHNTEHPDDPTRWTNSMFGGMPLASIYPSHRGDWTQPLYRFLMTGKRPASWLFLSMVGAFLLMLSLGISKLPAIGGAIAVTFCSYNLQIIQVGHNTKMQALAFLPWVLAAVIFTYRSALRKPKPAPDSGGQDQLTPFREWFPMTALGAVLFAFALSLQIKANHLQITYYLAIIIFIYALSIFIWLLVSRERRRQLNRFFAASALLLGIGLIGIATNTITLAPLYEYTQHTMRGGSELSHPEGGEISDKGLQLDYATAWSYGWEELPNLLIPNFNGGASTGAVNPDKSAVVKLFKQAGQGNPEEIAKMLPLYWGPQPFTAGPMYMGAITVFLFVLGLCLYRGKEKWWILAATLVAVLLSLGSHFMGFTRLFYNYAPLYNKFRTVSMSLVILQFTLPMLGFLVLDRILKQEYSKEEFKRGGRIALAFTAGFCLIFAVFPGLAGSFSGASDASIQDVIVEALKQDRKHLLANDALWSMLFILATYALLWWSYRTPKDARRAASRRLQAGAAIALLVLVNLFAVGKRYLNADSFVRARDFGSRFVQRTVDKLILSDPDLSYRVLDFTVSVFNDSRPSYWHKNVGGYSPAKLQRYQDLIQRYLVDEIQSLQPASQAAKTISDFEANLPPLPLLSALNCRYLIMAPESVPVVNRQAFGNAWFVDSLVAAANPDEEIARIGEVDLRRTAVIGDDFAQAREKVASVLSNAAPSDTLYMTSYAPNELRYHCAVASERPVIFSEIYYPKGWHAEIYPADGGASVPVELFRADWILRGAVLPAGEYDLVMRFDPKVYSWGENVSRASSIVLVLVLLASCGMVLTAKRETSADAS
jgi:hypothetical protein